MIEDDEVFSKALCEYLSKHGYSCIALRTGKSLDKYLPAIDLVLLDLTLPDVDGIDVLLGLRKFSTVPVVILSGRGKWTDRVVGLDLGADDYLVKPFIPEELLARLVAVFRRSGNP